MLLRITSNYFVAGCVWEKNLYGSWECIEAAPIIKYFIGMTAATAKVYIKRKGWKYEWLKEA